MDTQSFHDAVALVTRSNSRSGFTTRNLAELRTSIPTAMMLVRRYFSDNLNFYPMDTNDKAGLYTELVPFAAMAGDNVDRIGNIPKGKRFPENEFQSNHADSTNAVPDQGWNPRSKYKSPRKCEPNELLSERLITEMETHPKESAKASEITVRQVVLQIDANSTRHINHEAL